MIIDPVKRKPVVKKVPVGLGAGRDPRFSLSEDLRVIEIYEVDEVDVVRRKAVLSAEGVLDDEEQSVHGHVNIQLFSQLSNDSLV
jgi:hypothetical protein